MQKKQNKNEIENNNLESNIKKYYEIQKELKEKEKQQNEIKTKIISSMTNLQINKKEVSVDSSNDETVKKKEIVCTLYSPVSVDYNLETVKKDFPNFVEKDTKLSLSTPESIAAFKLKLKEFGLNKNQFKEIIDLMDICKIEKVNQTLIQQEYDKGNIEDISKYASIKEKTKYIKVYEK